MKKLNVVSSTAPFIAAAASSPGATNCVVLDRAAARARHLADERADADADRQQEEQRLDEPERKTSQPRRYDEHVALDDAQRAAHQRAGQEPQRPATTRSRDVDGRVVVTASASG